MTLTTERLLTAPHGFGLCGDHEASAVQRAICRVADGLPLGELADCKEVVRCMGGRDALARLPARPPTELYIVAAIRCGKSLMAACLALKIALTIDLSLLKASDVARVSVVSVSVEQAKIAMEHLMGALEAEGSALRRFLMTTPKPTQNSVYLRRPDGRVVRIVVAAGSVGGKSLVSRWTVAAIFDEAARMLGRSQGAVNLEDMRKAVIARLRRIGGQLVVVTSPWIASGPVYETTEAYWGQPSKDLVVVRATGPELCPNIWTPEACEAERLAPNSAYESDVLGEFVDAEGGFLTATEVRAAIRKELEPSYDESTGIWEMPFERTVAYTAAMDPAVAGNAWTLVIVGKRASTSGKETDDKYFTAYTQQWQGTATDPLKAREIFAKMAPILKRYKCLEVYSDRWGGSILAEHGESAGVNVETSKDSPEDISRRHSNFRTLLLDGRLELAPVPALRADLLSKRKKREQSGAVKYVAPETRDGRHADFADAIILAVQRAMDSPTWTFAMQQWRERGGI